MGPHPDMARRRDPTLPFRSRMMPPQGPDRIFSEPIRIECLAESRESNAPHIPWKRLHYMVSGWSMAC